MQASGVTVLYTTPGPTLAALETARRLAPEMGGPVRLVVMLPVPYPLPLSRPAVPLEFTKDQFRRFASQCSVVTRIEVYLCRDRCDVLRDHLEPRSLVVLGATPRRWWGAAERTLVRRLHEHGHSVVLAAPEGGAVRESSYHNLLQFRMPNSSH